VQIAVNVGVHPHEVREGVYVRRPSEPTTRKTAQMRHLLLITLLSLTGCAANPYETFYEGQAHGNTTPGYIAATNDVKVFASDNRMQDVRALAVKGYIRIGSAHFDAAENDESLEAVKAQARKLGAGLVVYSPVASPVGKDLPALDSFAPPVAGDLAKIKLPPGLATREVYADFYVQRKTKLGIYGFFLDEKTRKLLDMPPGVSIETVVEGSSAAQQGLKPGDLITAWEGKPIDSRDHWQQLLKELQADTVTLTILREGKTFSKTLGVTKL
jgi:hypothetical protein